MKQVRCNVCNSFMIPVIFNMFDDRYGAVGLYNIYCCKNCGFRQTDPKLKKEQISNFYKEHYPLKKMSVDEVKKQIDINNKLIKWIKGTNNVSHLYVTSGSDVLDIGSGSGVSLLEIENLHAKPYGVEPDPNSQRFAKALRLKVYKGFITENPFPGKKFDFITASQVIEHEPNPYSFLFATKKKLKKNGKVVLTFPNYNSLYRLVFGKKWIHWHVPYHINHFTKKSFMLLSKNVGYKIVRIRTITPNLWTLIQLRVIFSKNKMGTPSTVWTSPPFSKNRKVLKDYYFKSVLFKTLNKIAPFIVLPVNRLIDFLGLGESFLVELKKYE